MCRSWWLVCLAACIASMEVHAADLSVTREILIERGNGINADAIVETSDGGVVVAGRLRPGMPWATRLSADGHVNWRYVTKNPTDTGGFHGVLSLDDNSTILCGTISIAPGAAKLYDLAGLIVHLDKDGKPIRETVLYANGDKKNDASQLTHCMKTEVGIMVIGSVNHPPGSKLPSGSTRLWIVILDKQGNVVSEKVFDEFSFIKESSFIQRNHLFATSYGPRDKTTGWPLTTEVIKMSDNGTVIAHVSISGNYTLIKPTVTSDDRVILINQGRVFEKQLINELVLDENLHEVSNRSSKAERIYSTISYRLPDERIVSFGRVKRPPPDGTREIDVAAAAVTDRDLNQTQAKTFESFNRSDMISSAAPTRSMSEFVVARSVIKVPDSVAEMADPRIKDTFGVVVSHVTVH